jgi:hypothetical protein
MGKYCYYCGKEAVSKEHMPPKCFFTNNNKLNLVTVPSCILHNTGKSEIDLYARTIISVHRTINKEGITKFKQKTIKSIEKNPFIKEIFINKTLVKLNGKKTYLLNVDNEKIDEFYKYLSSGIYYLLFNKVYKRKWDIIQYSLIQDTLVHKSVYDAQYELFRRINTIEGFIDINEFNNSKIFKASYFVVNKIFRNIIIIKTVFYGGFTVYSISV